MASAAQQLQQALAATPYKRDGWTYPEGSKVSPNGMYYDNGNGWQFANGSSSMAGAAPGTPVKDFESFLLNPSTPAAPAASTPTASTGGTTGGATTGGTDTATDTTAAEEQAKHDQEIARWWRQVVSY